MGDTVMRKREKVVEVMAGVPSGNKTASEVLAGQGIDIKTVIDQWIPIARTYVEGDGGTQYLAEIQQNAATKEIRAVKV